MTLFEKYQSAGNDFGIFFSQEIFEKEMIVRLCHRRYGIGADGLLFITKNPDAYAFRIFNADGSEASMCGNGLRCAAHFIAGLEGITTFTLRSQTMSHRCSVDGDLVEVQLGKPLYLKRDFFLEEGLPRVDLINTGVPHAVYEGTFSTHVAQKIRNHPLLGKGGANVTCIENGLLRTFERGVEDETYSCGTGAAAAFTYLQNLGKEREVLQFFHGDTLSHRTEQESIFQKCIVHRVFRGSLENSALVNS